MGNEIFFLNYWGVFPGENHWIQGQFSGGFWGLGMLTPYMEISYSTKIFFFFNFCFADYFLDWKSQADGVTFHRF